LKRPNIKTVAKRAGVSTATVSRVLAGFEGVRNDTKNKVLAVIEELDYSVDTVARSLRQKKTDTIGLIVGNVLSPFYSIIAKSIEDTARESGYKMILCNGDDNPEKELEYLKVLRSNKVDGIILTPTGHNRDFISSTIKAGIDMVFLDRLIDGVDGDAVLVDNYNGSYNATEYLIKRDYKRIAIISGFTDRTTGRERLRGYRSALKDAGIIEDSSLIKTGDFKKESGIKLTRELLSQGKYPEAIFVNNIDMTLGSLIVLKEKGVKIPDDMAIISFDDPEWATITDPPLTAVSQPVYQLGKTAAEMLIARIRSKDDETKDHKPSIKTLDTGLVIRKSVK
jgi:DNA-binding LacI/PurR family transcriptional regulator